MKKIRSAPRVTPTNAFPEWMAAQRYRDKNSCRPELLAGYPEGRLTEFTQHLVEQTSAQIEQASAPKQPGVWISRRRILFTSATASLLSTPRFRMSPRTR